ncbi:group II truncated hemoglobin [Solimonas marina]|uniref:Group II truncated hemoglobin n=1 Tax=Solimonas marina TaxID=2714601 RepID=A0A970BAS0_9GAMM|nr:group II truncated hemoglobin [Solimonas marina]NKF23661.1 group II truncated hemoglobin [Solimonas marina]
MSESLHDRLGGEPAIRAIVDRFYDQMDCQPAFAGLRAQHPADLSGSRDKLYWYLCGWTGGASHYVERFGHPRLRARHLPFTITSDERDQWLACMAVALRDVEVESVLADELLAALVPVADWMRNRPDPEPAG